MRGGVLGLEQLNSAAKSAKQERTNMKIQNKLAILTVTAITSLFVSQASAQYRPVGDDGVTASPKVRAMLNERVRSTASALVIETTASHPAHLNMNVAASPKVLQMLNETKARTTAPTVPAMAVNQPRTADDGIAASPKVRAQLNERNSREIQVAPLK